MKMRIWITMMVMGLAVPAASQTGARGRGGVPSDEAKQLYEKLVSAEREQQVVGEVRSRMAVEARITPGKPYSADAITESTQALADGNRILRKSVTRIYRDSEGRTRREQINESGVVESVSIVDPVAHTSFVLQPGTHTGFQQQDVMRLSGERVVEQMKMRGQPQGASEDVDAAKAARATIESERRREQDVPSLRSAAPPPGGRGGRGRGAVGETVREELGTQNVEGVTATGTRTTTTIPAGAIGNLQPIKVVAEQWFSADLQVLVLTKHSDPRSGDTTYRLMNIVRAEPDRSLFTVPPDYTIKGSGIRQPALK
jgi:hypothetical protein